MRRPGVLGPLHARGDGWVMYSGSLATTILDHGGLGVPSLFIVYIDVPELGHRRVQTFVTEDLNTLPTLAGAYGVCVAVRRSRLPEMSIDEFVELPDGPLTRATRAAVGALLGDSSALNESDCIGVDDLVIEAAQVLAREARRCDLRDTMLESRLEALIEARHRDPGLDVSQIARELLTSRRQLYRVAVGGGVAAMIGKRRVMTACEMLVRRPDLTVSEVAVRSGFSGPSRLRAMLLRETGMTPSGYRQSALAEDDAAGTSAAWKRT